MKANYSYDLSLIIPCYNEEEILEENFYRIVSYLNNLKLNSELIFVEDCSQDATPHILERLAKEKIGLEIKIIYHKENKGRGGAVKTGILAAQGKVTGFIDVDLEVAEWYILPCVKPILEDRFDMVTGNRYYDVQFSFHSMIRFVSSFGYRQLLRMLMKTSLKDTETGYKFFNREKITPVLNMSQNNHWFWDTEIMLLAESTGLSILEIPCVFVRNKNKTSTVNVLRDSIDYFKAVFSFRKRMKSQLKEQPARTFK